MPVSLLAIFLIYHISILMYTYKNGIKKINENEATIRAITFLNELMFILPKSGFCFICKGAATASAGRCWTGCAG